MTKEIKNETNNIRIYMFCIPVAMTRAAPAKSKKHMNEYLVKFSNADFGRNYDHCAIVAESETQARNIAEDYGKMATKIEINDNGSAPAGAKIGVQNKASFER